MGQEEHTSVSSKLKDLQRELDVERRSVHTLQEETDKLRIAKRAALKGEETANAARHVLEADLMNFKEHIKKLEAELRLMQLRTPAILQQKLAEAEDKLEQAAAHAAEQEEKFKRNLSKEREESAELRLKIHKLQGLTSKKPAKKKGGRKKSPQK